MTETAKNVLIVISLHWLYVVLAFFCDWEPSSSSSFGFTTLDLLNQGRVIFPNENIEFQIKFNFSL